MQEQATETVLAYLERNNLPNENLDIAIPKNRDIADPTILTCIGAVDDVSILLLSVMDIPAKSFSGIHMIDMEKSAHNKPL